MKPKGHPIQPSADMVMEKVDEAMKQKEYDTVYLVVEDREIVTQFMKRYKEKLLVSKQEYVNYNYEKKITLLHIL